MSTITNIEDISTGVALRRRAHAVLDPEDLADLPGVATEVMKTVIRSGAVCTGAGSMPTSASCPCMTRPKARREVDQLREPSTSARGWTGGPCRTTGWGACGRSG